MWKMLHLPEYEQVSPLVLAQTISKDPQNDCRRSDSFGSSDVQIGYIINMLNH